jgi:integrase
LAWASSKNIALLNDVTPDSLDGWVAGWTDGLNTQGLRLSRIRSFFRWATRLRKIDDDPTAGLRSIKRQREEETMPLTAAQFDELIAATYRYDEERRANKDRFGVELRAVFLVQRWTGLRLSDVLMLRRSAVSGNRIVTTTQKTGAAIDRMVPDVVIEALNAVPRRKSAHDDQFFWSRKCDHRVLAGMWTPRVRRLNRYLNFKHPRTGEPMPFHSHMLRDTFAVELLLSGMSLEKISYLLTHESVQVTQKHYAPWVPDRQKQLESEMLVAMRKMGVTFGGD